MKRWNRFFEIARTLGLISLLLILAGNGVEITVLLRNRVILCLHTLVPSLFACMVLANILMQSGTATYLGRLLPVRTFGKNVTLKGIFVLSQLAGYPVGTVLLRQLSENGGISDADARRLSAVCYGSGPAFAVGLVGTQVFGSAKIGWLLMFCTIAANLCLATMISPKYSLAQNEKDVTACESVPKVLAESVAETMRGLWGICGIVLMFGVVTWLLERFGILMMCGKIMSICGFSELAIREFLVAFLDVTQLPAFCQCGIAADVAIPISSFLLTFGGVCVLLQCAALGTDRLSMGKMFLCRIFAGILSAGFARILLPLMLKTQAVSVFSPNTKVSETGSVLPGLLIFFIGFPLLLKKD